jgi:hypothetical protein
MTAGIETQTTNSFRGVIGRSVGNTREKPCRAQTLLGFVSAAAPKAGPSHPILTS